MQVADVDFDQILRMGDNYITVVLQNRSGDKGGFSLRLDMDKAGSPVIRKSNNAEQGEAVVQAVPELDFELYPNPSSGMVYIKLIQGPSSSNTVSLFDINGRLIETKELFDPVTGETFIDLTNYPKGVYFVRIQSDEVLKTKPLVRF